MSDILCDLCDDTFTDFNSLEHYTGILNGQLNSHIHVCLRCSINFCLQTFQVDFDKMKEATKEICFDHFLNLSDHAIQILMNEIDVDILLIFLKGSSETLRNKVYNNVSERRAEMLYEDVEIMGPIKPLDIKNAQRIVINEAKRL